MAQSTPVSAAPVLVTQENAGIVTLTLNRPQQYNALSLELLTELLHAVDAIAKNPAARVVVIAGTGKAFCAGHDLKEMRAHPQREFVRDVFSRFSQLMMSLTQLPQPVIARVHGAAFAAGCQLVAQCDLAVAADTAQFATSGVKYGLFCNTPGVALARNMSRKQALEMLLTGDAIDAHTALARGLLNRVVTGDDLDAEIAKLAQSILDKTPVAVAAGKRAFYRQVESNLEQAYELATEAMVSNMLTEDAAEGIDAFAQKRKPQWKGR
jgi:enoyl-CoA hydratase/carnithine racemase